MHIYKKSFIGLVAVALIVGTGLGVSGVNFSGDIFGGKIPWWCVQYPVYVPGENSSGEAKPTEPRSGGTGIPFQPGGSAWRSQIPDFRSGGATRLPDVNARIVGPLKSSLKNDMKKLDPPYTPEIAGSGSRSGGSRGVDGVLNKNGSRNGPGGISIPGVPGVNPPSGEQPASSELKKDPGYWIYQLKCPDGYSINYSAVDADCTRIKMWLDSGKYTEKTLPPEWKAKLPACKRAGSWFSLPKMSEDDCDKFFIDMWANNFQNVDNTKWEYCWKMHPNQEKKSYKAFKDQCVEYKKNGGYIDPKVKEACEKQMWWWKSDASEKDCKKIFSTISSYKALGGDICELEMGPKTDYCKDAYPGLDKDDVEQCYKGGGGGY